MTDAFVIQTVREALVLVCVLALPALGVALVVGLVIGVLQATTQVQEQSLVFVPKIIAVFLVLALATPWLIRVMVGFTTELFARLPQMAK